MVVSSGSMSVGSTTRRAAQLVDSLGDGDVFGLVTFNNGATDDRPDGWVEKQRLRDVVDRLSKRAGGRASKRRFGRKL